MGLYAVSVVGGQLVYEFANYFAGRPEDRPRVVLYDGFMANEIDPTTNRSLYVRLSFVVPPTRILDATAFAFLRLQAGSRCKIFKTKEFPAK
jgi:hypothetical protein